MTRDSDTTAEIRIRDLVSSDYDSLLSLWSRAELLFKPMGRDSRPHLERQLQQPTSIYLAAESAGRLVGSVLGTHDGRKGWINRLAVDPDFQKRGIASKLVAELESRLEALGIDIVACLVEGWNETSIEVFTRLGYKPFDDIAYFTKRKSSET